MLQPELLKSLKEYNGKKFVTDISAGIIVGIVALPLAIAFGIASGVGPSEGIFTAIVAGFIISALGGSKVQIGGPTGAFVVIVYGVIQKYGMAGLATATIMAGVILILLGVLKLGSLVKFIPYTIITGFTAGIAVTIFTTQIGDFFGLTTGKMPGDFLGKVMVYAHSFGTINWCAFVMATICLVLIFVWPRFNKKIPGSLVVIVLATIICTIFNLPVDTIGDRYQIPTMLPKPQLPAFSVAIITELFPTAASIAILAAIESLLSAVVADGMIGAKHDSDQELIAQGIANMVTPIFGGIPATGAIARTATNVKNGGRTPVAGIIHAVVLLLILLALGRLVAYIPMPALAAILVSVAWNMAGFGEIKALLKGQKSDITVLATTFVLTVFIDLTVAIGVGLLLAAFFFIQKMALLSSVYEYGSFDDGVKQNYTDMPEEHLAVPDGVLIYEVEGPLFFATVRKFEVAVERSGADFRALIIRMRNASYLDAGGIKVLRQLYNACSRKNISIVLSGVHQQPLKLLKKSGMFELLGTDNICADIQTALERTKKIITG
ncbi:MAG: STAS domain-containing protein [Treponema sp.]|nr:STAS domain-containing protein [Treponema sp.]